MHSETVSGGVLTTRSAMQTWFLQVVSIMYEDACEHAGGAIDTLPSVARYSTDQQLMAVTHQQT